MNVMDAHKEWATRPDDQRFPSLAELRTAVAQRKRESWTATAPVRDLRVRLDQEPDTLSLDVYDPTHGERRVVHPTHWAFGQLAQYANAPASYLRRLPATLAGVNLQWGLERDGLRDEALILGQTNGSNILRSMTSTSYGRIWDEEVVAAVERVNQDGRWQIPAASYATTNPKRATTLYASDRDVFLFLVDPSHPITVGQDTLFRGFIAWNSEVGSAVFGLTTFLYRYVCDNRIVWGATDVKELRIRHTGGAPERFLYEGAKYLAKYAEESAAGIETTIRKADAFELPPSVDKNKGGWAEWLTARGFTGAVAKQAVESAKAEEGEARSLWDIINGLTAHARSIPHTDERVKLEAQAGKLLNTVQ